MASKRTAYKKLMDEWLAAAEALDAEFERKMAALSAAPAADVPAVAAKPPAASKPVRRRGRKKTGAGNLSLPAGVTRSRRVLDAIANAADEWVNARDIARAIAPAEKVDEADGEKWQTFVQQVRNALSGLKRSGHIVDRGGGSGDWKLTEDAALAYLEGGRP